MSSNLGMSASASSLDSGEMEVFVSFAMMRESREVREGTVMCFSFELSVSRPSRRRRFLILYLTDLLHSQPVERRYLL